MYSTIYRTIRDEDMARLSIFITKQAKTYVSGVGLETDLERWGKDFSEYRYSRGETWEMEGEFANFDNYLADYMHAKEFTESFQIDAGRGLEALGQISHPTPELQSLLTAEISARLARKVLMEDSGEAPPQLPATALRRD